MIAENNGMYKTTRHQFRITITYGTSIKAIDANIPLYAFDFVPIERILSETNLNEFLIGNLSYLLLFLLQLKDLGHSLTYLHYSYRCYWCCLGPWHA